MTSIRTPPEASETVAGLAGSPGWDNARPRTLVDYAVEAIVAGAARGSILPGDRIVETDISQALGISRVPVREALRLLESQGVVVSQPYKGIRLTPFTRQRLEQLLEVRTALEITAARRAIALAHNADASIGTLVGRFEDMQRLAHGKDIYVFASADTAFHRELCRLSGNDVLCDTWETLARQLTVVVGLTVSGKPMPAIAAEHRQLLDAFGAGDAPAMDRALIAHLDAATYPIDVDRLIARRKMIAR